MGESSKRSDEADNWSSYMQLKKRKLRDQFKHTAILFEDKDYDEQLSGLFSGISIYVNGLTEPTADDLRDLMIMYGGKYDHYYSRKSTTHIIASNLCFSKIKDLKPDQKVVRAEWITESIKAKKLLPYRDFMLYIPGHMHAVPSATVTTTTIERVIEDEEPDLITHTHVDLDRDTGLNDSILEDQEESPEAAPGPSSSDTSKTTGDKSLKAGDPGFLETFFNKSRLHHLSTAGNEFKTYLQEKRHDASTEFKGRQELISYSRLTDSLNETPVDHPIIMHIDMDCFFVSVGLLKRPDLIGKPVVVTHAKTARGPQDDHPSSNDNNQNFNSHSEIACASYEARRFGIKNGSFLGRAKTLCPDLVEMPYDFEGYSRVSRILYDTICSLTLEIEAVSCDEMFVDITEVLKETKSSPEIFATFIRNKIKVNSGCTASAGLGPNVLIAKLASKKAKPNGQLFVAQCDVRNFMMDQKLSDIPGIGRSTCAKLSEMFGATTCGDLFSVSLDQMKREFGLKSGEKLFNICRGIERHELKYDQASSRKSVSAEVNYGIRMENFAGLEKFLYELSEEVSRRLQKIQTKGRQVTLKVKIKSKDAPRETLKFMGHGVCDNISRSTVLPKSTDSCITIYNVILTLVKSLKTPVIDFRGIGIQVSKLDTSPDDPSPDESRKTLMINDYFKKSPKKPSAAVMSENSNSRPDDDDLMIISDNVSPHKKPIVTITIDDIDEDTLSSLPEDIRTEVLNGFKKPENTPVIPKVVKHPLPKKKLKLALNGKKGAKNKVPVVKKVVGPLDQMFKSMSTTERRCESLMSKKGALCGKTNIHSIKNFITEWVSKEQNPMDTDVACMVKLLTDFIDLNQWKQLREAAETFYIQVLNRNNREWSQAYNTVISLVRSELGDNYFEKRNLHLIELND